MKNKKKTGNKIYHVHFNEPVKGKRDHYFGSLTAIYTVFTSEQIGCKVERLWDVGIRPGHPYSNKKCTISQDYLIRKTTDRGKN